MVNPRATSRCGMRFCFRSIQCCTFVLAQLEGIPVVHSNAVDGVVEESYSCDAAGGVKVTIRNLAAGYEREYHLCRWTGKTAAIRPTATKRARRASS